VLHPIISLIFFNFVSKNKKNSPNKLENNPFWTYFAPSFNFLKVKRIYKEEVRDRLGDPLATWKIQGANSCQV